MGSAAATGVVQRANFDENTAASHAVVAAESGKQIQLTGCVLIAAGNVTITIEDSDGTNLIGPCNVNAVRGFVLNPSDIGHTETPSGKGLNILLSDAVQVGGNVSYKVIK